jgi:hypothetical protein
MLENQTPEATESRTSGREACAEYYIALLQELKQTLEVIDLYKR